MPILSTFSESQEIFDVLRRCLPFKGEHWYKTKIKGAQDWGETEISASAVFEKKYFI